ncbi:HNH endonuclease signature motif containing protein [Catelliglobosispora koreensis]|uniref:HNH endonuclease signature motif containing protein n=1 Tax=Catelliglobosispora koreensis TaxID=129052 RepID=UPI00035CACD3
MVEELVAAVRAVAVAESRVVKALAAVAQETPVREFAPMEIASAVTWSRQAATARLASAQELLGFPCVFSALALGDIDLTKARIIAEGVSVLASEPALRVCAQILRVAAGLTAPQLRARLARLVLSEDPASAVKRHEQKVSERRLVFEPDSDGCANVFGLGLPAAKARAAIKAVQQQARLAKAAGDTRTMDQLRADIFLERLSGKDTGGRGGSVELTVTVQALANLAETPGDLAGYGPVIADIARQVAALQAKAQWTFTATDTSTGNTFHGVTRHRPQLARVHTDAAAGARASGYRETRGSHHEARDDLSAGRLSPVGEALGRGHGRRPTAEVVRHLRARDRTCQAPGCRVPARACDLDHCQDWAKGGLTEAGNLVPLCRHHHRAKHHGGWRYWRAGRGAYTWRSPLGRIYRVATPTVQ